MQDAKHHKVNNIAIRIADSDAENSHDGKAQPGQQSMNNVQHRRYEQEQEFQRFRCTADNAGD